MVGCIVVPFVRSICCSDKSNSPVNGTINGGTYGSEVTVQKGLMVVMSCHCFSKILVEDPISTSWVGRNKSCLSYFCGHVYF